MRGIKSLIPMTLFAAVAAVTLAFIVPAFQSIVRVHAETIAAHEQLERRYQTSLARSRAQRELVTLERTMTMLRDRIPTDRNALEFVRTIEGIAAARQLEVRIAIDWSTMETPNERPLAATPMTIELNGPYPALVAALRDVERLPFPPVASHLSISETAPEGARGAPATRTRLIIQSRAHWRTISPPRP
ncbi:MAG: type 4a pilus biogenesis protein PilO [bacterium]|nr:type 4a pilus biogenesis protein PilO [bacterium]